MRLTSDEMDLMMLIIITLIAVLIIIGLIVRAKVSGDPIKNMTGKIIDVQMNPQSGGQYVTIEATNGERKRLVTLQKTDLWFVVGDSGEISYKGYVIVNFNKDLITNQSMVCPSCGHNNIGGAQFCSECGKKLG